MYKMILCDDIIPLVLEFTPNSHNAWALYMIFRKHIKSRGYTVFSKLWFTYKDFKQHIEVGEYATRFILPIIEDIQMFMYYRFTKVKHLKSGYSGSIQLVFPNAKIHDLIYDKGVLRDEIYKDKLIHYSNICFYTNNITYIIDKCKYYNDRSIEEYYSFNDDKSNNVKKFECCLKDCDNKDIYYLIEHFIDLFPKIETIIVFIKKYTINMKEKERSVKYEYSRDGTWYINYNVK